MRPIYKTRANWTPNEGYCIMPSVECILDKYQNLSNIGLIHIIVTWSGVLYQVEWMRSYHWITRDAWPHAQDVILYTRSSYFYDNMFIICLFLTFYLNLKHVWTLIPKNCGNVAITLRFYVSWRHIIMFSVSGSMLEIHFMSPQKQVTDVSLVLKDSDTE